MRADRSLIRLHLHRSEEPYYHQEDFFPIDTTRGTRIYFHAKPYILLPKISLTIELTPPKPASAEVGKIIDSGVKELHELELGNAQA